MISNVQKKEEIERTIIVVTSMAYQSICKVDFGISIDSIKLAQFMLNNKHNTPEVFKNGYEICSEWKNECFKSCNSNDASCAELFTTLLIVNVQKDLEGTVNRKFCNAFKK